MSRKRGLWSQLFALTPVILVAVSVFVPVAAGQTTFADLPADCSAYASVPLPADSNDGPVPKHIRLVLLTVPIAALGVQ